MRTTSSAASTALLTLTLAALAACAAHDGTADDGKPGDDADTAPTGDTADTSTGPDTGSDVVDADEDGAAADVDCDDADANVFPGATEAGATGVDEDCDGWVDLDGGATAAAAWHGEDWAWAGSVGLATLADVDGDRGVDLVSGSAEGLWVLGSRDATPGAAMTMPGDAVRTVLPVGLGDALEGVWSGVAVGPDVDGDGTTDLVAAGSGRTLTLGTTASVAVFTRASLLSGTATTGDDAHATIRLLESDDGAGPSGLVAGDVDGDGVAELIVGDPDWDGRGRVLVFATDKLSEGGELDALDAAAVLAGGASGRAGANVTRVGDVNGDGNCEVAVGDGADLRVLAGPALWSGGDLASAAPVTVSGAGAPAAVLDAGDLDADGRDDVLVVVAGEAATDEDPAEAGALGVWLGLGDGGTWPVGGADAAILDGGGPVLGAATGALRGDGRDLVVAVRDPDAALVLLPLDAVPLEGTLDLAGRADRTTTGDVALGEGGILWLGDLDGDGDDDLAATAPGAPDGEGDPGGGAILRVVNPR